MEKGLTRIFGVLGADVVIARVQDVFVHEGSAGRDLSEERDFDGLADLDALALLHEDLARVLAAVLAVEGGDPVLLWVVALLEGLQGGHEIVPAGDAVCDDAFCDSCGDGALDDGGDRVHGPDDLGLELGRHVELDLLEEVFRRTETTDDKYVLELSVHTTKSSSCVLTCRALFCA